MRAYLADEFPQAFAGEPEIDIEHVGYGEARVRLCTREKHLRPGGTISGPTMMMMADCATYIALLSMIGKVPLAVTTNLNINFLRKPPGEDLICEARPLKAGKTLFVAQAVLYGAGDAERKTVAHATLTYSIPPRGE